MTALSRLAALTLLAALAAALWAAVGAPLWDRAERLRADIAQTEGLIAGYEERAGAPAPGPEAPVSRDAYLTGATAPLAAAALQDRVTELAKAEGAAIRSIRGRDAGEPGGVGLRVALSGDYAAVVTLIYRLEAERPLLFIPNLTLTPTGEEGGDGGRAISALIDIDGFRPPGVAE